MYRYDIYHKYKYILMIKYQPLQRPMPLMLVMIKSTTITIALSLILIILSSETIVRKLDFPQVLLVEVTSETELLNVRELAYYILSVNKSSEISSKTKKKTNPRFPLSPSKKAISQTFGNANSICIRHCTFQI